MKTHADMAGMSTAGTTVASEHAAQLRALSGALREVHRGLMEVSRARFELRNGPVRSNAEFLHLLLNDDAFEWLGPLSRLIVEIDELTVREPTPTEAETAAMRAFVKDFISSSDDGLAFGSRYVGLLASEPRVAIGHLALSAALDGRPGPEKEEA